MSPETTSHACDPVEALRHCSEEVDQLREALHSRPVIDQAKGILMARYTFSAERAFALLTRVSQDQNQKVRHLAEALVASVSGEPSAEATYDLDMEFFDTTRAKEPRGSVA